MLLNNNLFFEDQNDLIYWNEEGNTNRCKICGNKKFVLSVDELHKVCTKCQFRKLNK